MKIIKSKLRAIVERSTEIEFPIDGEIRRLYVFQQLGEDGKAYGYRIQNWECDVITHTLDYEDVEKIIETINSYYYVKHP
jgi:hypothetical protein